MMMMKKMYNVVINKAMNGGVNDRESFWDDNDDGDHTRNDYLQMKTPNNADNRITLFQLSAVMF